MNITSVTAIAGLLAILLLFTPGCGDRDAGDTIAPEIRIVFPPEDTDVLNDVATIRVDVRDNVGIKQVVYMAEGDTLDRLTISPFTLLWNTTAYPDCTDADSYVLLTATAEDFAGNSRSTTRTFYLDNEGLPPVPVELFPPTNVTKHSATLSWEQSLDYDFSHYILRRDTSTEVIAESDSLVRLELPESTSFTDADTGISPFGLLEDADYYYRVYVHDVFGRSTGSDSVMNVHTLLPESVPLRATSDITKYTARLQWDPSSEDVAYYRLHRGPSPQVSVLDSIAGFAAGIHTYTDSGLTANTTYYYYVYLVDEAGYTHRFNADDAVEVRTLALPAAALTDPATNIAKYSATVLWSTIPEQEDSSWVALYRGPEATVDDTDDLIYTGPRNERLSLTDTPLRQGTTYYYSMRHWDSQDNSAWSNTITLTTLALEDVWGGGLGVSEQGKYELRLTWDAYNYTPSDFASYTLSRDEEQVFSSVNPVDNQFLDTGRAKNTAYLYRLEVADTSGATVAVTLEAATRDILAADIVSLAATDDWSFQLAWLPSQEPATEFDHYELLRSDDTTEIFVDDDDDHSADCLLSGDCQLVTTLNQQQPSGVDTITYLDNDPTLVIITPVDTATVDTTMPIYNYVVLTYDRAGGYVRSNIAGDTLYSPPTAVVLSGPEQHGTFSDESILLNWTGSPWPAPGFAAVLFSRYEIWRFYEEDEQPWLETGTVPLSRINDMNVTTFSDGSEEIQGGSAWYVVLVRDIYGQYAVSNKVFGFTSQ
ncbi:MAG: hypothetical protein JSW54_12650 [Fidelibacterota bacterium]|nr:MAG: hypothetical protein JSW54_12650 [Candidatus Neomarinimicrobiota bacterium]